MLGGLEEDQKGLLRRAPDSQEKGPLSTHLRAFAGVLGRR